MGGTPQGGMPQTLAPQGQFDVNQAAAGGLQQAMLGTQREMGYRPQQIQATDYRPATIAGTNLSAYTNPYEDQVVNQALGDIERFRKMGINQTGASATQAGAFGGSRHGIAEAETNRSFAEQAAQTASNLRQAGFQNAQQLAGQDVGAMNAAAQFGATNQMTAQTTNAANQLAASQQRLGAASQMGGLGQQAFNTGQTINSNLLQQGGMQQNLNQQIIDAAKGQYQGFTGAPAQGLSYLGSALGMQPNQSTTTDKQNAGPLQFLQAAAAIPTGGASKSDIRLKENLSPKGSFGGVNFYSWDWNDEGKRVASPDQPTFGVIADELQKTHPHLVHMEDDGYLAVDYRGLAKELTA